MAREQDWEAVIGLEVHAQLLTRTKLFCGCATSFGDPPNTHVCPTCLGLPGALPVLNEEAVRLGVRAALALGCTIAPKSRFARKNYFYPDLPKGYQISQFDEPFASAGSLDLAEDGGGRAARIQRIHFEEDAGKTLHDAMPGGSVVDLNRAGTPLVEIVGEPDLRAPAEASAYLRALRDILVFAGVNDGNLEEGSFRCDANVSIRRRGDEVLGTRVELKNINSFRFVEKAIASEIARQADVLESGGRVVQETRGWDEASGTTYSLRSKEAAHDYRYFPDPDLPPVHIDDALVADVRGKAPELPRAMRARFVSLGLTPAAAAVLTSHPRIAAFYDAARAAHGDAVKVANFVASEVLRDVTTRGLEATIPVAPSQVAELLTLVDEGTISGKQAKDVYARLRGTTDAPRDVVRAQGLAQVSDPAAIEAACAKVLADNPKQAADLRAGKTALLGFFVGQVMKATGGSANPALVNETLRRLSSAS